ncbi:MAG: hypothetical protein FWG50_09175 [Kiritimatiellaeota bacterium]|nr:hypothetical protein [Kiritimatiellota bacterium]
MSRMGTGATGGGARGEFRAAGSPSLRGFGWVLLFLAVAWFGASGGHERVRLVSLIGLLWPVPYALRGKGVGRLLPAGNYR